MAARRDTPTATMRCRRKTPAHARRGRVDANGGVKAGSAGASTWWDPRVLDRRRSCRYMLSTTCYRLLVIDNASRSVPRPIDDSSACFCLDPANNPDPHPARCPGLIVRIAATTGAGLIATGSSHGCKPLKRKMFSDIQMGNRGWHRTCVYIRRDRTSRSVP